MSTSQPQYEITEADKRRQKQIADAWKAYDGMLEEQLQVMANGINPNANSNRLESIIFSGVNFLAGKPVQIAVSQGSPPEAQTFLEDTWGRTEKRMPLLQDLSTSGGVAGQAFLRIVPDKRASEAMATGRADPQACYLLRVVDPMNIFVQTAPKDYKTVMMYCIEYSVQQMINGSPERVYYREEICRIDPDGQAAQGLPDQDDTWIMQSWTRVGDRGAWVASDEPITWPYPFAPIFSCQNRSNPHDFWGKSDITPDLIQQNEDINLNQSGAQKTSIIHSHPLIYSKNTSETVLDVEPGRITQLPPDGELAAVAIQSDMTNVLAFLANLRSNMDEQSAVPAVALGRQSDLPKGQVSGVTMELLFMPLLAKTEMKRCRYGELIIEVSEALLQLAGFSPDITVKLSWKNPLPHDDLQSAQAMLALQQAGVSINTVLTMFGFDPDAEEEKRNNEAAHKNVAFSRGQGLAPPPTQPPPPGQVPPEQQQQGQDQQGEQHAT